MREATWVHGRIPVTYWAPTGGVTRRGPEMAPQRQEWEWAAWPSGDQSRAVFCDDEEEARATARACGEVSHAE